MAAQFVYGDQTAEMDLDPSTVSLSATDFLSTLCMIAYSY